jgi:hypothetical protein
MGDEMKTLKEKSQEFIELGTKITQGTWYSFEDVDTIYYPKGHNTLRVHTIEKEANPDEGVCTILDKEGNPVMHLKEHEANDADLDAVSRVPQMINHIKALQAVIDDYEGRLDALKLKSDLDVGWFVTQEEKIKVEGVQEGLKKAVVIMTGEDKGEN